MNGTWYFFFNFHTYHWKLVWDEDKYPQEFPQNIYNTPEHPDIVVWSNKAKEVTLIKQTVGDESNFSDHVDSKETRYNKELIPGIIAAGWKAWLFTIEVGCRGFWYHTVPALLNYFGLMKKKKEETLQEAALTALCCSYSIWSAHNNKNDLQATALQRDHYNHQLCELGVGPIKHVEGHAWLPIARKFSISSQPALSTVSKLQSMWAVPWILSILLPLYCTVSAE